MFYEYDYLFLAYICVHCTCACRGQKRVLNLETKSQVPMSCGVGARNWILVSWIGASALNCQAVSPDPKCLKKKIYTVHDYFVCMLSVYHLHAWYLQRPEKYIRYARTGSQMVVSHTWVLGTKLRSSGRASYAAAHWAISPVLCYLLLTEAT